MNFNLAALKRSFQSLRQKFCFCLGGLVLMVVFLTSLSGCSSVPKQPKLNQPELVTMPVGFVYLDEVAPEVLVDLKYAGYDNFIGRPLDGYRGKRAILRVQAAEALRLVSDDLMGQGYRLVIYDAYRPHTAMIDINAWARDRADQKMKARFYPRIDKDRIFEDKYLRDYSEHSRGVAVDISLVDRSSGKPVDMGGHHDLLDPSSATAYPNLTHRQKKHRQLLKETMERHGFVNYSLEWWHYRLSPEPDTTAYYYFPVWDGMKSQTLH